MQSNTGAPARKSAVQRLAIQAKRVFVLLGALCLSGGTIDTAAAQTIEMIRPIPNLGSTLYEERSSPWSACSNSCGTGVQTRTSECVLASTGQAVDASKCGGITTTQSCTTYSGCSFSYTTSPWETPAGCGPVTQTRTVGCQRSDGTSSALGACAGSGTLPDTSQTVTDTRTCSYGWVSGSWSAPSSTCSNAAVQTRTVSCTRSDPTQTVVADTFCGSAKPADSRTVADHSQCTFNWSAGSWSAGYNAATPPASGAGWTSTCTPALRQDRVVQCVRQDGQVFAGSNCDLASRPSSTQDIAVYTNCSYSWYEVGNWSTPTPSCGRGTSSQTQTVLCRRNADNVIVSDGLCSAASKPSTTRAADDFSTCTYSWNQSGWGAWDNSCSDTATRTQSVRCLRSDGDFVDDSSCSAASKPPSSQTQGVYTSCNFQWQAGGWTTPAGCGWVTSTQPVSCQNVTLGRTFADSYCNAATRPATTRSDYDTRTCTYAWETGAWGGWNSSCSDSAARTRTVQCKRSDNQYVADGYCNLGTKPATSESAGIYSGCSFGWAQSGFSTPAGCGWVTSTQSVWCHNYSLGRAFADGYCGGAKPSSTRSDYDVRACSYAWNVGAWGGWSNTCTYSAYRYRSVFCQRSDGANVSPGEDWRCGGHPGSQEGPVEVRSGCTYSWQTQSYSAGACSGGSKYMSPNYDCRRNVDGALVSSWYCGGAPAPGGYYAACTLVCGAYEPWVYDVDDFSNGQRMCNRINVTDAACYQFGFTPANGYQCTANIEQNTFTRCQLGRTVCWYQ